MLDLDKHYNFLLDLHPEPYDSDSDAIAPAKAKSKTPLLFTPSAKAFAGRTIMNDSKYTGGRFAEGYELPTKTETECEFDKVRYDPNLSDHDKATIMLHLAAERPLEDLKGTAAWNFAMRMTAHFG